MRTSARTVDLISTSVATGAAGVAFAIGGGVVLGLSHAPGGRDLGAASPVHGGFLMLAAAALLALVVDRRRACRLLLAVLGIVTLGALTGVFPPLGAWVGIPPELLAIPLPAALMYLMLAGAIAVIVSAPQSLPWQIITLLLVLPPIVLGAVLAAFSLNGLHLTHPSNRVWYIEQPLTLGLLLVGLGILLTAETRLFRCPAPGPRLRSLAVSVATGVLLIVLLSASIAALPLYGGVQSRLEMNLKQLVLTKAEALDQFRRRVEHEVMFLAHLDREANRIWRAAVPDGAVLGATWLDSRGHIVHTEGDAPVPPSVASFAGWSGEPRWEGPQFRDGIPHFMVRVGRGESGTMVALVDFSGIAPLMYVRPELDGPISLALAYRAGGQPEILEVAPGTSTFRRAAGSLSQISMEDFGDEKIRLAMIDRAGEAEPQVVFHARVGPDSFGVIGSVAPAALYAPANRRLYSFLLGAAVLALLGTAGMMLLIRRLFQRAEELQYRLSAHAAALESELAQRQRAEHALRAEQARTDTCLMSAPDGVVTVATDGRIVSFNPEAERLFGRLSEEVQQRDLITVLGLSPLTHGAPLTVAELVGGCEAARAFELEATRGDGTRFPIDVSIAPLAIGDPGCAAILFVRDVTTRFREENRVKTALREKEILLKEIHHRVKNNLQVISSLLNLQTRATDTAECRRLCEESQHRIKSIALIHELLYQSENLSFIQARSYLERMGTKLLSGFGLGGRVSLTVGGPDVPLELDAAVPFGLIANELLTNSMRHAFPEGRSGTIDISIEPLGGGLAALRVSDNGVGFPKAHPPLQSSSLGMRLIMNLVRQLDGQIEFANGTGSTFRVIFTTGSNRQECRHAEREHTRG